MRDTTFGAKYLTVARVMELLQSLPADARLHPNDVGNILVMSDDGDESLGHIDFLLQGKIERYGEDDS